MSTPHNQQIILTDVDGVLLDWATPFYDWMREKGYQAHYEGAPKHWDLSDLYQIDEEHTARLCKEFNESPALSSLKPFRHAADYVQALSHEGYRFVAVTSYGTNSDALCRRFENLTNVFGDVFDDVISLPLGSSKVPALTKLSAMYPGAFWIEDHKQNVDDGIKLGLRGILVNHEHNADYIGDAIRVGDWSEIYDYMGI